MKTKRDRTILHCDLNNFFASVECIKNPELRGKPIAVCGDPRKRHGIVLAKSEQAKKFGVKTGDTIWEAQQKCPDILIISTNHADYSRYGKMVREIYYRYTDKIESMGCDEAWLDVTESIGLFGDGKKIADEIRETVKREYGLTLSIGVSFNKTFAKLGSDYKKPDATTVISRGNFREILYPLPVSDLLYVGRKSRAAFEKLNIKTIGDLAAFDEKALSAHMGIMAGKLISTARGEDNDPVGSFDDTRVVKSVGNGTTTPHDLTTFREAEQVMYLLCEEVAYRMRKHGVKGFTVSLSVRSPELVWKGAQTSIAEATNSVPTILKAATEVFKKVHGALQNSETLGKENISIEPVRSLRVAVSNLTTDSRIQLSLFGDSSKEDKNDKISAVFDKVRRKYGTDALFYGSLLKSGFKLDFETLDEIFQ